MAIASLIRKNPPPTASVTGNLISATELWCLKTTTITSHIGAITLINALQSGNSFGWMVVGVDSHPENTSVFSTGFDVDREERKTTQFDITTTLTNDINFINASRRALDANPVYDYPEVDTLIEIDIDPLSGEAIAASNGEPYFPKIQRNGTDTRIVINRNEVDFDPNEAKLYRTKLNKTSMKIDGRDYEARSLLLESWTGKSAFDVDDSEYYQVRYVLLYDPENFHKIELIDAASGPDKRGVWPLKRGAPNKPYKLGRDAEGDGNYMSLAKQRDPNLFFTKEFNLHEEIDMRFLRL